MCGGCLDGASAAELGGVEPASGTIDDQGLAFVRDHPTIDIHAHPGRFFLTGEASGTALARELGAPFVEQAVADMAAGHIASVWFATVADHVLLELTPTGLRAVREFRPGEAYADHRRQMAALRTSAERFGLAIADARPSAAPASPVGAVISVEGGDFIEDRLERIEEARAEGVRSITIVHYHVNQVGDAQTEQPVHAGLSALGADIVAEIERNGIVVDLSHASFATCAAVAEIATRPPILSHSNLRRPGQSHPRLIDPDHARLVTALGGVIGAVQAGFDQVTFDDYIDTILYMAEALGVEHVAIGTDMDYTYKPVMTTYRQWPGIAGNLLRRGMAGREVALVMGGNIRRLLDQPC